MGNNISLSQIEQKWVKEWTGSDTVVRCAYNFQPISVLLKDLLPNGIEGIINEKAKDAVDILFDGREDLINNRKQYTQVSDKDYRMALDFIGKVLIECMKNMNAKIVT